MEDSVHHGLEGSWRVCEPKEHYGGFEQSFWGEECCFPFISFFDPDVVISPPDVYCSEQ